MSVIERDSAVSNELSSARVDLLRCAAKLVGRDEAEDVVQTAIMRTWANRSKLRGKRCYVKYAMRAVRTVSIDLLRSRTAKPTLPLIDYNDKTDLQPIHHSSYDALSPEDRVILDSEREGALADLLGALPRDEAALLFARYGLDYDLEDIQSHAKLSPGQLRNRLHRAKKRATVIPKRFSLTGTAVWAFFQQHAIKAKIAIGAGGGKTAAAAASVVTIVALGAGVTQLAPVHMLGDPAIAAQPVSYTVPAVESSPPPTPVPASSSSPQPAPSASTTAPVTSSPAASPSALRAASPSAQPTAAPSPRPAITPPPAPAAPATPSITAPTTLAPSPSPSAPPLVITSVCRFTRGDTTSVSWRVVNNTANSFGVQPLRGSLSTPSVQIPARSTAAWTQESTAGSGQSWRAESTSHTPIGASRSAAQIAALPSC